MVKTSKLLITAIGLLAVMSSTQAAEFQIPTLVIQTASTNIVANGGFETGNFASWTQAGNLGFTGVSSGGAFAGTFQALLGPVGSTGSITQVLTTVAGNRYDLSYRLRTSSTTPNSFQVFWSGGAIASLSLNNASVPGWTSFSALNLVATGPSTSLSFVFRHDPGFFFLDEVSVTATPEASTMALVGGALMLLGFYRRGRYAANPQAPASSQRPSASDRRT